jgi:hypothetical protein
MPGQMFDALPNPFFTTTVNCDIALR